MKKGKYQYALSDLQNAKTDSKENKVATAEIYKNIAKCHEMLKEINDALANYDMAQKKAEEELTNENRKEKNLLIMGILLERGKLYMKQRMPKEALVDFNNACEKSKDQLDVLALADLYLERGKCLREEEQFQLSIKDLQEAVAKLEKSGAPKRTRAEASNQFGYSYFANGQFELVAANSSRRWISTTKRSKPTATTQSSTTTEAWHSRIWASTTTRSQT